MPLHIEIQIEKVGSQLCKEGLLTLHVRGALRGLLCLRFGRNQFLPSRGCGMLSMVFALKCPVLHLQHLTSRLDSIPRGFGNFCFRTPTWTGNHCHVSMLQCRPWEHQKTSTISVAPNGFAVISRCWFKLRWVLTMQRASWISLTKQHET